MSRLPTHVTKEAPANPTNQGVVLPVYVHRFQFARSKTKDQTSKRFHTEVHLKQEVTNRKLQRMFHSLNPKKTSHFHFMVQKSPSVRLKPSKKKNRKVIVSSKSSVGSSIKKEARKKTHLLMQIFSLFPFPVLPERFNEQAAARIVTQKSRR